MTQDSENITIHRSPGPFLNKDRRVVCGDGGIREWSWKGEWVGENMGGKNGGETVLGMQNKGRKLLK